MVPHSVSISSALHPIDVLTQGSDMRGHAVESAVPEESGEDGRQRTLLATATDRSSRPNYGPGKN
jgi:hypothetical protein